MLWFVKADATGQLRAPECTTSSSRFYKGHACFILRNFQTSKSVSSRFTKALSFGVSIRNPVYKRHSPDLAEQRCLDSCYPLSYLFSDTAIFQRGPKEIGQRNFRGPPQQHERWARLKHAQKKRHLDLNSEVKHWVLMIWWTPPVFPSSVSSSAHLSLWLFWEHSCVCVVI